MHQCVTVDTCALQSICLLDYQILPFFIVELDRMINCALCLLFSSQGQFKSATVGEW